MDTSSNYLHTLYDHYVEVFCDGQPFRTFCLLDIFYYYDTQKWTLRAYIKEDIGYLKVN